MDGIIGVKNIICIAVLLVVCFFVVVFACWFAVLDRLKKAAALFLPDY